jgi:hypothetical protein
LCPPRRRRILYENDTSVFGSAGNIERVAVAIAEMEVGPPLTQRERRIAISDARFFAGAILDGEAQRDELARKVLELTALVERQAGDLLLLQRLLGEGGDVG